MPSAPHRLVELLVIMHSAPHRLVELLVIMHSAPHQLVELLVIMHNAPHRLVELLVIMHNAPHQLVELLVIMHSAPHHVVFVFTHVFSPQDLTYFCSTSLSDILHQGHASWTKSVIFVSCQFVDQSQSLKVENKSGIKIINKLSDWLIKVAKH